MDWFVTVSTNLAFIFGMKKTLSLSGMLFKEGCGAQGFLGDRLQTFGFHYMHLGAAQVLSENTFNVVFIVKS